MHKTSLLAAAAAIVVAVVAANAPAQAQPYGGYGPGWGMMGGYGPGWMMGQGYGPGMMGGYGPGWGGGPGYGHGWMMRGWGGGYGPGMMYGYGPGEYGDQGDLKLSTDQVKSYFDRMIRNPNLKVGDVKEKDADTIVAEVVTKEGNSLVQRIDVNRHTGYMQPEQ